MVENLIMYLRKSRADNPAESVEEVLSKHERILQDFSRREYGAPVPEPNIYREVVSGESIADRIEIRRVLSRIERGNVAGIVVVEPQRLSRGDLVDCGTLINILQYTNTPVITPIQTYDLSNKMERRFFQDELMRGRDYLEYTKEILMRGKLAAIDRGCFLQSVPPYGYDRIRDGKDYTLAPNDRADVVRMIFSLFAAGVSTWQICGRLYELGIPSPSGHPRWTTATVDKMLRNRHYIGKVTYQKDKTTILVIDGEKVAKRIRQAEGDYIERDGKHPAIIDAETFEAVRQIIANRPTVNSVSELRNAFAGLLYCARCGRMMAYKDKGGLRRYLCCKTPGCSKSVKYDVFTGTVLLALRETELPELRARYESGDCSAVLQQKQIVSIENSLRELRAQEDKQYDLLETKVYTQEVFERRHAALEEKIRTAEAKVLTLRRTVPAAVDYPEKIATLQAAITALADPAVPAAAKNALLKTIIERIDITSDPLQNYKEYDFDLKITLRL